MDAPFNVGDVVVCVQAKPGYLLAGNKYTIKSVYADGRVWFVTVHGVSSGALSAHRFELVAGNKTKVESKIKQMEQRFIKRQEEKKNESMCCL